MLLDTTIVEDVNINAQLYSQTLINIYSMQTTAWLYNVEHSKENEGTHLLDKHPCINCKYYQCLEII